MSFRVRWGLVLALLSIVVGGPIAWAEDAGAVFSSLSNQVEVFPEADPQDRKFAKMRMPLAVDDHVLTGEESSAILSFSDLSTLLLKAESEIVLAGNPAEKGKIDLVVGKIWINVKRMVAGDNLEVRMVQTVTGIKGTNITCGSEAKTGEEQIQVLRGTAEVTVLATREKVTLQEGEELIVKPGGRTEKQAFSPAEEQKNWSKDLTHIGDQYDLNEIPDLLERLMDRQEKTWRGLQKEYAGLAGGGTPETIGRIRIELDRFLGVLLENEYLYANFQGRIEQSREEGVGNDARKLQLLLVTKRLQAARSASQNLFGEVKKMLQALGGSGVPVDRATWEIKALSAWSEVAMIRQELDGHPTGQPQDWFVGAQDRVILAAKDLGLVQEQVAAAAAAAPADAGLKALLKRIESFAVQTAQLLRDLNIVRLDTDLISRMMEYEDQMTLQIGLLQSQVQTYDVGVANSQLEAVIRASLGIYRRFSLIRRFYEQAKRLYGSVITSGRKYRTAEQEQLAELFQRITDAFLQAGNAVEELQVQYQDLQDQLGTTLR